MAIKITTYGQLAEMTAPEIILENIIDSDILTQQLEKIYPSLLKVKYLIVIDKKIIHGYTLINESSCVALLPPFSGG